MLFFHLTLLFSIVSRFNKKTDLMDEKFCDISEWEIVKESKHQHACMKPADVNFTLSKHEIYCDVAPSKALEREFFVGVINESKKRNRSVVPELRPAGNNLELETRLHDPGFKHRMAKEACRVLKQMFDGEVFPPELRSIYHEEWFNDERNEKIKQFAAGTEDQDEIIFLATLSMLKKLENAEIVLLDGTWDLSSVDFTVSVILNVKCYSVFSNF